MQNINEIHESDEYMNYPFAIPKCYNSYNSRSNDQDETSSNISRKTLSLEDAILEIKKSIEGEKDDAIFYAVLLSQAPTEEDRKIIESIISDEKKHNQMFKMLYSELTQKPVPRKYYVKI